LRRLSLRHPTGATRIAVGAGAFAEALPELGDWLAGRTAFVVTTPRVMALHGGVVGALGPLAGRLVVLEVEEGEAAKNLARAGALWERLLAEGGKRDSRILAFGGGSVGDLAGFVAASFLRGVEIAQLPTTVLAQVDASIGGKTAIDMPAAKNSVGAFHHPEWVISDAAWLRTLPDGLRNTTARYRTRLAGVKARASSVASTVKPCAAPSCFNTPMAWGIESWRNPRVFEKTSTRVAPIRLDS